MSQGHMPGPWVTQPTEVDEEYFGTFIPVRDATKHLVALIWNDDDLESEHANARLVAAAPDLLAACKMALQRIALLTPVTCKEMPDHMVKAIETVTERCDAARDQLRVAIARAEGMEDSK